LNILLDTNIVIMLSEYRERLPETYLKFLTDPATRAFVSVVSLWEMSIKYRSGKLVMALPPDEVVAALPSWRVNALPLSAQHAISDTTLHPGHKDPFDRMILAVAHCENLALMTTDRALLDHPLAWRP